MSHHDDPDSILPGEEVVDDPECQIAGCDRPGSNSKLISRSDSRDGPAEHYVCRRHYRILLGLKASLVVAALGIFLFVAFGAP